MTEQMVSLTEKEFDEVLQRQYEIINNQALETKVMQLDADSKVKTYLVELLEDRVKTLKSKISEIFGKAEQLEEIGDIDEFLKHLWDV